MDLRHRLPRGSRKFIPAPVSLACLTFNVPGPSPTSLQACLKESVRSAELMARASLAIGGAGVITPIILRVDGSLYGHVFYMNSSIKRASIIS
ncbi:hypothetical protein TNIN_244731 [Trichonephila inaurata madagascariensis]|uniref:Uncharacterized protein n=1 Tax=Trichonephila inaurata madagascariensis TaxID=2747483 RepID=A0A8X6Y3F9_9ARAC|nr:hypothetical protein TNIN_244731 [Trichonephila inaurata madagascariensis]